MAENWISRPELEEIIGREAANALCRAGGGVPLHVPYSPDPTSWLGRLLGPGPLAALCAEYGGMRSTVPNGRRPETHKRAVIRLLEAGHSHSSIALELGVTERYVRMLAAQVRGTSAQYSLL